MASGLEDMGKENASTAGRKETASEKEADPLHGEVVPVEGSAGDVFGNCGMISVLFEMPSGFAIFGYDAVKLTRPDAWKHIWADFVGVPKAAVWLKAAQSFKDKGPAISNTTVSTDLSMMIRKYVVNGQTLAVGNKVYGNVIWKSLGIRWVCSDAVKELMWGLNIQMPRFLSVEYSELTNKDRFPMSEGMSYFLNSHKIDVNLNMMVTNRIIEMAAVMYECDRCVDKYDATLRLAAEYIMKISRIDTDGWDLLKLATAFKMICFPEDKIPDARRLFPKKQFSRLMDDAPRYEGKIMKNTCLKVYTEMYSARKIRLEAAKVLVHLVDQAKKAYEDEQAGKAASDHEIGPVRKKICRDFAPVLVDELTQWHTMISAKRNERKVPPTPAPFDALRRYSQISSHPLDMTSRPCILSMDIHPSKDIVATGGIVCTLTGHSKKITSLKFVNRHGLFITGSADKTVRIWQGIEDENYSCIQTLKDHTAEVEAVTVHASQQYFATASSDNSHGASMIFQQDFAWQRLVRLQKRAIHPQHSIQTVLSLERELLMVLSKFGMCRLSQGS